MKKYKIPLLILFFAMICIHNYIHLYADDFYYARDIAKGINYIPTIMSNELKSNGRVWVHILLSLLLYKDILIFRIVNPIVITLSALVISRIVINISLKWFIREPVRENGKKDISINIDEITFLSTLFLSLFFIGMPLQLASTTIYYAACSVNYHYPIVLFLIYVYLLYDTYLCNSRYSNINLIGHKNVNNNTNTFFNRRRMVMNYLLSFFIGSSSQQVSVMALSVILCIFTYLKYIEKKDVPKNLFYIFVSWSMGFIFILYGSLFRFFTEKGVTINNVDWDMNILVRFIVLIHSNLFSRAASLPIFLFTIIAFLMILYNIEFKDGKIRKQYSIFGFTNCILYLFLVLIWNQDIKPFDGIPLILIVFFISFVVFSLINMKILIYYYFKKYKNPIILNLFICGFISQIMLIFLNPIYTFSYKLQYSRIIVLMCIALLNLLEIVKVQGFTIKSKKIIYSILLLFSITSTSLYFTNLFGYMRSSKEISANIKNIELY